MKQFKDYILIEKIVGNAGWVYHRTKNNPEDSDIVKYGIRPSSNESAMYGKGLYCCYDFDQQLKSGMEKKYGNYILKGKIDLNNFAILDEDIYRLANPRGDFEKHLENIGTNIEDVRNVPLFFNPYTSSIAEKIWRNCKQRGYNGIIFTGGTDGRVAVIWNRINFIPYQYTEDDGDTWKKLNPDISSIKRPHDPEYDRDDETLNFSKILKELKDKEEIGNLIVPVNYSGTVELKKLKKCGNIIFKDNSYSSERNKKLILPQLQECGKIDAHFNVIEIDLPQLIESRYISAYHTKKLNLPNLQINNGFIYAENVEELYLPRLKKCESISAGRALKVDLGELTDCWKISVDSATEINLLKLEECKGINAHSAEEINLPQLQVSYGNIQSRTATIINLPQLQECGNILADNATEVNLSKISNLLFKGELYLDNAKEIIIPKEFLRKNRGYVHASPDIYDGRFIFPEDAPQIKVDENTTFKKYLILKESLVQIPLDTAYEIFKKEYEESTGTSWTRDKFMGRASNWEFYGDDKGYVAIRRQRSGLVKLVGMAGDNRSKLKGINDLVSMNLPLWGMVSKDIKDISVRRGMREPNFLERQVLKRSIPPEVLGGAEILDHQKDGGIKLKYPDVGVVVKYLVGTPQYYSKLRELFGDKLKEKILG